MTRNIMRVGVGGQGTILASKLLTAGLMKAGYDVKMSEIHGMSQRGGAVSSQVRYGEKVESPIIEKGTADVITAFEKMEALRALEFLKEGGRMVVNEYEMPSMPIITGDAQYPHNAVDEISKHADVISIDATSAALKLGSAKTANIILLGVTIKAMGLTDIDWEKVIAENVKADFVDINIKALGYGMGAMNG